MDNDFPEIKTKRLILRRLREDDIDTVYRNWSDPVTMEKLSAGCLTYDQTEEILAVLQSLWEVNAGIRWGIEMDGQLLGTCGFHNLNMPSKRAEVGYELYHAFWRQGIMKEAMQAVIDFGFYELNLVRIEAFTNVDNERSTGFLRHLGFTEEGTLRDYEDSWQGFIDQRCFSILRREWK